MQLQTSLTFDETALNETAIADESKVDDDGDVEMVETTNVVKQEPPEVKSSETNGDEGDDDDVIVIPALEPVVTEITDEPESEPSERKQTEDAEKEHNLTDDDVMIQEPNIETQLVDDDDDEPNRVVEETSQLIVKIKEEPKDDGYEDAVNEEEDPFVEVTAIANDDIGEWSDCELGSPTRSHVANAYCQSNTDDDAYTNSPKPPFQPALDNDNAVFDESSFIMMSSTNMSPFEEHSELLDDDASSRPESSGAPTAAVVGGTKKLKFVLSSLAQNNLSNKNFNSNSNHVTEQNENSNNLDSINKLDSNVELQTEGDEANGGGGVGGSDNGNEEEEPEIAYQVKPQLQAITFERNRVPVKRGFENSGLCSIM